MILKSMQSSPALLPLKRGTVYLAYKVSARQVSVRIDVQVTPWKRIFRQNILR